MKRKVALFLTAVMAASSLPVSVYAANFKDIYDVPWAAATIESVAQKGLISGYEDNTFRAANNVTYPEAMQMVYTLLMKTGTAKPIDAVTTYSYMNLLATYQVPKWAQMAVAYGLSQNIVNLDMVVKKFSGGQTAATREDVAILFGNAIGSVVGKEQDISYATRFVDSASISADAMEQVGLLHKLGIVGGDTTGRFHPQNAINRAEMAVMLHNSYQVLTDGIRSHGEITKIVTNEDSSGNTYYNISVRMEKGYTESFALSEGDVPVYEGDFSVTIGLSSLTEGDAVSCTLAGDELVAITRTDVTQKKENYDICGYIETLKDHVLHLENENTGEIVKYDLASGVVCTLNGKKMTRTELEEDIKNHPNTHAYAGLRTESKRKRVNGIHQDVLEIKEIHVTYQEEYTVIGTIDKIDKADIQIKMVEGSSDKGYDIASNCKFYVNEELANYAAVEKMVRNGTTFVKVTIGAENKVTSLIASGDSFAESSSVVQSKTYHLSSLSDKKIVLSDSSGKITYNFSNQNPLANITFYTWGEDSDDWDETGDVDKACDIIDDWEDTADDEITIYVKVMFNSSDKLNKIYLSTEKNAWKHSEGLQTERNGIISSLEDGELKFEGASSGYKLLKSYEEGTLINHSAWMADNKPASKTVLERMANDKNLELYGEVKANGAGEATYIEVKLKSAQGKLVEFDREEEKTIEIKTSSGNTFKLHSQKNPKLTNEEKGYFELSDLEGAGSKYVGDTITLGFSDNGIVNRITVGGGAKTGNSDTMVSGDATATDSGVKIDGKEYKWMGKTGEIETTNRSGPAQGFDTIQRLLNDPDVEAYAQIGLEENTNGNMVIGEISVRVTRVEGTLKDYDHTVHITTDSGNSFSFYPKSKLDHCDVNGFTQSDLKNGERGMGTRVEMTFNAEGNVVTIESK